MVEYTICIQFRTDRKEYFGTSAELHWRNDRESELSDLLSKQDLGFCDGGQAGNGSMEIFLVVTDITKALSVVTRYLTDNEWLPFCKVASLDYPLHDGSAWQVHHPVGGKFSAMEWL